CRVAAADGVAKKRRGASSRVSVSGIGKERRSAKGRVEAAAAYSFEGKPTRSRIESAGCQTGQNTKAISSVASGQDAVQICRLHPLWKRKADKQKRDEEESAPHRRPINRILYRDIVDKPGIRFHTDY